MLAAVGMRVETERVSEDGVHGVGVQPELGPVSDPLVRGIVKYKIRRSCLHRCDNEGTQGNLVQEPVVTGGGKQVLTELFRHAAAKHTVT